MMWMMQEMDLVVDGDGLVIIISKTSIDKDME
jgi:hypothetical protein